MIITGHSLHGGYWYLACLPDITYQTIQGRIDFKTLKIGSECTCRLLRAYTELEHTCPDAMITGHG